MAEVLGLSGMAGTMGMVGIAGTMGGVGVGLWCPLTVRRVDDSKLVQEQYYYAQKRGNFPGL